jgi:ATP-binding cassette subfamily C protein
MTGVTQKSALAPELRSALRACRKALVGVALASGLVNLLMLTGPLFMLQVYDRALPSRSVPTLVGLALLALTLYAFQCLFDMLRGRVLTRIGRALDDRLSTRVFDLVVQSSVRTRSADAGLQPLRDLDAVRSFSSSLGLAAFFDLPWVPLYVTICFLIHPAIGWAVLIGAVVLSTLALVTDVSTRASAQEAVVLGSARRTLAESARRNAAVLQALGMRGAMTERWNRENARYLERQQWIADVSGGLGSASRVLRMVLQSAVLGLGAYLVINQEASVGVMLAAMILTARALAPVDLSIANWRNFIAARQSWRRLSDTLATAPGAEERTPLPRPSQTLRLTAVSAAVPGGSAAVLHDVSVTLAAGSALGVIGPSGSGKSSLARLLVGVWAPARGVIRLDGATLDQWPADQLGQSVGYLPQEVELFDGTVAENIARFRPADPAQLIAAAKAAGVHDIVVRLPNGYDTRVGENGAALSGGQRQRIALARALYGEPFLVVLDEPNSNLDAPGEQALTAAILGVRARGGIVIVIAHRPSAVAAVDQVLILNEGRVQALGPRERFLPPTTVVKTETAPPPAAAAAPPPPEPARASRKSRNGSRQPAS